MSVLGVCGLVLWTRNGFPERFPSLPGIDVRKIGNAKLDANFKPTTGMEVLDRGWTLVTHLGQGERKVALSGDSQLFHYGPRVQQQGFGKGERKWRKKYFFLFSPLPP